MYIRVMPARRRRRMADLGYDFYYYENIEGGHGGTVNQEQRALLAALEYTYFLRLLMRGSD